MSYIKLIRSLFLRRNKRYVYNISSYLYIGETKGKLA